MSDGSKNPGFRRLQPANRRVAVVVDGQPLLLPEGEPLAAALLAEGKLSTSRSLARDEPRGPFCLMGTCGQCAAEVDGIRHQRTCRTAVRPGMRVTLATVGRPGDEE